tara:strand:- start:10255 stop:11202 length:948 start_codon:yes stop_codon:yes gene_type:complete
MNRRNLIKSAFATGAAIALGGAKYLAGMKGPQINETHNFSYCLNTSTIRNQNLGLMGEMEVAAEAGFSGIEIWMRTLQTYLDNGGKTSDIRKKAEGLGLTIEDSIGFASWIVDDDMQRKKAMEQMKYEMDLLAQIGCKRIAAPPSGATNGSILDLKNAAKRFRELCDLGKEMGVLPQLELWGFSNNLHLFGETLFVAAESGNSEAVILPDVYHLRRGGSPFEALELINGNNIQMFHINDYPGSIAKSELTDSMRVLPGDGDAPMKDILKSLNSKGVPIVLSLEIFNEDIWAMDALEACKLGISKMKASVESAISA